MNLAILRRVVETVGGIGIAYAFSRQCRKPAGWVGRCVAAAMNVGHGSLTRWGLASVPIETGWRMLDIGCGGGQTIRLLAEKAPAGHVDGVDYSPASVAVARRTNARLIQAGRVDVQQGSVSRLPFPDASFDLVTAVETHYYWPDLASDLREVLRVLRRGGRFAIIAETYKGRRMDWLYRPVMQLLLRATYLTLQEHREAIAGAGFSDVEVRSEVSRGWVSATGRRP